LRGGSPFLTAGCPENEGAHNRGAVARSFFRSVCMTCGAWPPCHKVGTLVHARGDFARDTSGREWGDLPLKGVDLPGSSHASLLLHSLRPSTFRASRWGAPVFSGGIRVRAIPSGDLTAGEQALVVVLPILPSSCYCWRSATPWGLAHFRHRSASRIFIMQPGRNLWPVVIRKDDYQPCGGEKRAELRPPPALSFKDVHHPRWGGRRAELGSRLPHGLVARFFLQHSGEKGVHQPRGGGELRVRGTGQLRVPPSAVCLVPQLGWPRRHLRRCLLPSGRGVAARPPHGRRSCRA
jgi:hypothetical protein